MDQRFARAQMVFGPEGMARLAAARVAVFGIGGVGSYAVEALARAGVGQLDLIDNDCYSLSNLNRQLYATEKTVGRSKVEVAAERIREIHPGCRVRTFQTFYLPQTRDLFRFEDYDYIIDAIDTVTAKLDLAEAALAAGVPILSAMGTGNKIDPSALRIADIYETSVCPLARIMRSACRKRGIPRLKVVYSLEKPIHPFPCPTEEESAAPGLPDYKPARPRDIPGSVSFVPSAAGLLIAGEVVRHLTGTVPQR